MVEFTFSIGSPVTLMVVPTTEQSSESKKENPVRLAPRWTTRQFSKETPSRFSMVMARPFAAVPVTSTFSNVVPVGAPDR